MPASIVPLIDSKRARAEELGAEITELSGYLYAATYHLLILIREFDETGGWELSGFVSCAHWLNFHCGIGMNAAREKVRVAHALAKLPTISDAFRRGEVSYSKVRAMTRVATPENEDYLLMIARHGTAHHVEKLVRQCRRVQRLSEAGASNAQFAGRSLTYRYDEDGSLVISARLPAEDGAVVLKALELAMEGREAEVRETGHVERMDEDVTAVTRGEGDLVDDSIAPKGAPTKDGARQGGIDRSGKDVSAVTGESYSVRRADALMDVAKSYFDSVPRSVSCADRYQVVVHMGNGRLEDDGFDANLEDGPYLSPDTARRLACDCSKVPVQDDLNAEPLSIGRKSRSIPPAIRRALRLRDKGCRFPGCMHTRYVDGHHIEHWADGGETSLENLVQLCGHHHRLVHEGGFDCRRSSGGEIAFFDCDGKRLSVEPPSPQPADMDPIAWFETLMPDVDIDAETCGTLWDGVAMDYHMAVDGVMPP